MDDSYNTARIGLRTTPEEKEMLKYYAKLNGMSLSQLMVDSSLNPINLPLVQREISVQNRNILNALLNNLRVYYIPPQYLNIIEKEIEKLWQRL